MNLDDAGWIDESLVERILRNADKDESIKVSNMSVKAGTQLGDNYMSDIQRVSVRVSKIRDEEEVVEEISIIFKIAPQSGERKELVRELGFFDTEVKMMSETLPKMNEIVRTLGRELSPRCYYVHPDDPTYIVLEDLATRGFKMAARETGLDLEHCVLAVRNLAKFHASSVALKEKDPKAVISHRNGMFRKDLINSGDLFFKNSARQVADMAASWPELDSRIPEKILKLSDVIYDKAYEATITNEESFNVLTHGDAWVNNMLFRWDETGKPFDIIFVDFQICAHKSPAVDLLYFLATSPMLSVRKKHRKLLIREYHIALISTMALLKCTTEPITITELHEEMRKRYWFEISILFSIFPLILADKNSAMKLDDLINREEQTIHNPGIRSQHFRNVLTAFLPIYDSEGLLDV